MEKNEMTNEQYTGEIKEILEMLKDVKQGTLTIEQIERYLQAKIKK